MLRGLPILRTRTTQLMSTTTATVRSRSASASPPPAAKRQRLAEEQPVASSSSSPPSPAPASPTQQQKPQQAVAGPSSTLDYRNKAFLAPMVRSGTLPARLLSLQYGADLVWGPEVVDRAIIGCERAVDERTGLITYHKKGKPQWWTHPVEKDQLIFQIGTADPELAVQAALTVERDVAGVDLNCGCPKPFSTHNGAGAGLLSTPDLLCSILTSLVAAVSVPVSCKIRLLPDQADTLALVDRICQTGIRNLTVHARTKSMRSTERALMERLRDIVVVATKHGIPVAANGDVGGVWDFARIKEITGVSSIMIARAAESNYSCFLPDKALDTTTAVIPELIRVAHHFGNPFGNTKFLVANHAPSPFGIAVLRKDAVKAIRARGAQARDYAALARAYDPDAPAGGEEDEEEAAMNVGADKTTDEVLASVRAGIERRKREREQGIWACGGEGEKRAHAGEAVPGEGAPVPAAGESEEAAKEGGDKAAQAAGEP